MPRTTMLIAGVGLVTAVAFAVGTAPVGAAPRVHTESFQARATDQVSTGPNTYLVADQDVVDTTTIGHDVLVCTATQTHSSCRVAVAQAGGLLYAQFILRDADGRLRGVVTGGTGRYRDAHGTLTGAALSKTAVQITLRYSA